VQRKLRENKKKISILTTNTEDKLALGTFGVDDVVMNLLDLFHGVLAINHGSHPPGKMPIFKIVANYIGLAEC
jgi:hypothetical protein